MGEAAARFFANRLAVIGAVVIGVYVMMAIFAPWLAPHDPFAMEADIIASPSRDNWLGADEQGRDILSRIIYGARVSLWVGIVSVGIALSAGTAIGVAAGYFGGWADAVLSRLVDTLLSFPDIFLALVIMAILGESTTNVMIAIGIV